MWVHHGFSDQHHVNGGQMAITFRLPPPEEYTPPCSGNSLFYAIHDVTTARKVARICRQQCKCMAECAAEAEEVRQNTIGRTLFGVWGGQVFQMEHRGTV